MTNKRLSIAFKVSAAYLSIVLLVFFWYESSLGGTDNSGLVPGLILVFITLPGAAYGGSIAAFFHCTRYSLCEHFTAMTFAGGVNTIVVYVVLRVISNAWKKRDET